MLEMHAVVDRVGRWQLLAGCVAHTTDYQGSGVVAHGHVWRSTDITGRWWPVVSTYSSTSRWRVRQPGLPSNLFPPLWVRLLPELYPSITKFFGLGEDGQESAVLTSSPQSRERVGERVWSWALNFQAGLSTLAEQGAPDLPIVTL